MISRRVRNLIGEDERLKEMMEIPISDILKYKDMAANVDTEEALRYLAEMFIDNCGVSLGMRGFADYCSCYWIKKLDLDQNPKLKEKYHNPKYKVLAALMPYLTDKYDEEVEEYDSCQMSASSLRRILFDLLKSETDEKVKIILCAGIYYMLPKLEDDRWLNGYKPEQIEQGIVNLQDRTLIRHRYRQDRDNFYKRSVKPRQSSASSNPTPAEATESDKFTDEEIAHFKLLNERLVELQHEVMDQVRVITANLREQIAKGFHQYDTFCIEGYIYIEGYQDENNDELIEAISEFAKYSVITSCDDTTDEDLSADIADEHHWYANWSGDFNRLEETHDLRFCRAFVQLFEEEELFTLSDIMKIQPSMLYPHVEINI